MTSLQSFPIGKQFILMQLSPRFNETLLPPRQ
jgi:hypothetical protein